MIIRIIPKTLIGVSISVLVAVIVVAACASSNSTATPRGLKPSIVVTYSVLGSIVAQLVGDSATVTTLIPDGQDPHEFQPSARDIETLNNASIVISNGLNLEEGLIGTLSNVQAAGILVFAASDFITVRRMQDATGHSVLDPHLWLSPATILEMLPQLAVAISSAIDADLSTQLAALESELKALDTHIQEIIGGVTCQLVTGHDELGYFADRYGCEVIGAIVPSLSTTSETSAGELADLKSKVEKYGVAAVFTGLGTSQHVAEQLASELGVKAVTLSTHFLDGASNYQVFMLRLADQIAHALG